MATTPRAVRNLRDDITAAQRQLTAARIDGAAEKIHFWAARVNELLDQYPRKVSQ